MNKQTKNRIVQASRAIADARYLPSQVEREIIELIMRERRRVWREAAQACEAKRVTLNIVIPGSSPVRRMNHEEYDWNIALSKAAKDLRARARKEYT